MIYDTGIQFHGKTLKRSIGLVYWWSWGGVEFDIRSVREALGISPEFDDDWKVTCSAVTNVIVELEKNIGNRSFEEVMRKAIIIDNQKSDELLKKIQNRVPFSDLTF